MKKIIFKLVLILGVIALLTSCISTKYKIKNDGSFSYVSGVLALGGNTYKLKVGEVAPSGQDVVVTFTRGGAVVVVKQCNNTDIKEELYGNKAVSNKDKVILTVPAGRNSFIFDTTFVLGDSYLISRYPFKNLEVQYNLEAGNKYEVRCAAKSLGFFKGSEFIVGIYDVTNRSELLKEWKLGDNK